MAQRHFVGNRAGRTGIGQKAQDVPVSLGPFGGRTRYSTGLTAAARCSSALCSRPDGRAPCVLDRVVVAFGQLRLVRDAESEYLNLMSDEDDAMKAIVGGSITTRRNSSPFNVTLQVWTAFAQIRWGCRAGPWQRRSVRRAPNSPWSWNRFPSRRLHVRARG